MRVIKIYVGLKNLEHIQYNHNDYELIKNRFELSDELSGKLCDFLEENDFKLDVIDTFDPQSLWQGFNFIINNVDISGNGFCFTAEKLSEFLEKSHKTKIKKFGIKRSELSKTERKEVDDFFNNKVKKD